MVSFLVAATALSGLLVTSGAANITSESIRDKIMNEERFVVFNSRRLTGECLPICVPGDTGGNAPPVQTGSPTGTPTGQPTPAPTNNPTNGPTNEPTELPTSTPTGPFYPQPPADSCPKFNVDFGGQICGEYMETSELWYSSGLTVVAKGDYTPNGNGVHIEDGGMAYVNCPGGSKILEVNGDGPSTLTFSLTEPTFVNTITTTGLCEQVEVFYASGGSEIVDLSSSNMVMRDDVTKMEVGCSGPGGVEELNYMYCPPAASCPLKTLDFSSLVRGQWVHDEFEASNYVVISAKKTHEQIAHKAFTPVKNGGSYGTSDAGCKTKSGTTMCTEWNEGVPRVFDTAIPQCEQSPGKWRWGDPDLGAPNKEFGGNGVGCGGGTYYMKRKRSQNTVYNTQKKWDPPARDNCMFVDSFEGNAVSAPENRVINPWVNNQTQGMVLIINEHNPGSNPTQSLNTETRCPDDTGKGGFIIFRFTQPVSLQSLELLDTDESKTPEAHIKYCDGTWNTDSNLHMSPPYKTPKTGDNGFAHVAIEDKNVCELHMKYYGSGSFSKLKYGVCPP